MSHQAEVGFLYDVAAAVYQVHVFVLAAEVAVEAVTGSQGVRVGVVVTLDGDAVVVFQVCKSHEVSPIYC